MNIYKFYTHVSEVPTIFYFFFIIYIEAAAAVLNQSQNLYTLGFICCCFFVFVALMLKSKWSENENEKNKISKWFTMKWTSLYAHMRIYIFILLSVRIK